MSIYPTDNGQEVRELLPSQLTADERLAFGFERILKGNEDLALVPKDGEA